MGCSDGINRLGWGIGRGDRIFVLSRMKSYAETIKAALEGMRLESFG